LFANILNILQPVNGQNEYAIKVLMRICLVLQEKTEPYLDPINAKLTELLSAISKVCDLFCFKFKFIIFSFHLKQNPSKPNFNHYLFETFGVLIIAVCIKNRLLIQKFEAHLFSIFNYVLEQDITEFIPYAFQLLSLMLELQDQSIPQVYHELFPFLLMPVLWERPGYVPALVRLLQAYI
jgi:exportin-2 (importin alpha re-exporter)